MLTLICHLTLWTTWGLRCHCHVQFWIMWYKYKKLNPSSNAHFWIHSNSGRQSVVQYWPAGFEIPPSYHEQYDPIFHCFPFSSLALFCSLETSYTLVWLGILLESCKGGGGCFRMFCAVPLLWKNCSYIFKYYFLKDLLYVMFCV